MPEIPVVQRLVLSQYRQFRYCDLSLTHPESGEPHKQICLLGANGAGKSSVLLQLYRCFQFLAGNPGTGSADNDSSLILMGIRSSLGLHYLAMLGSGEIELGETAFWFDSDIESSPDWKALPQVMPGFDEFVEFFGDYLVEEPEQSPLPRAGGGAACGASGEST